MRQQWLSPIGPRVPAVEAHPTAMPPDTESDEEHKATKAYPESPGEHARAHTHTRTHSKRQASTNAGTKPSRHISQTCTVHIWTGKQTDKHKSRWMHSFTGIHTDTRMHTHTHTHTHTDWHGIKNLANHGPAQTQTCWYSLAQELAITTNM